MKKLILALLLFCNCFLYAQDNQQDNQQDFLTLFQYDSCSGEISNVIIKKDKIVSVEELYVGFWKPRKVTKISLNNKESIFVIEDISFVYDQIKQK